MTGTERAAAEPRINLYSDTQTRPTPAMREAMARAEVGDEQAGLDPTVNALCARVADLFGHEAALFLPSGTMANQIAVLVRCRPGDEVLADRSAHILNFEGGGAAANAGVQITPLDGARGVFSAEAVAAAVRDPADRYAPPTRLVVIENTANMAGGTVWPLATIEEIAEVCRQRGLALHCDGARLMNAAVAGNVEPKDYARPFDSVWLDLSKGLGCPIGAVLAGSRDFVAQAWRWKQRLGGAMRQAGIVAAAGLHALDHHVARLAEDHANARRLADGLGAIEGIEVERPETNLVFFSLAPSVPFDAAALVERLRAHEVRLGGDGRRLRAVTHLDVDQEAIDHALSAIRAELAGAT